MTVRHSIFDRLDNSSAPSPAEAEAHAALRAQAGKTAASIIETRANRYALYPRELDALEPVPSLCMPLSVRTPKNMRQRIAELIGVEAAMRWRPGNETIMLNLRAAMVYAERLCDIEAAQARYNAGKYARTP